VWLQSKSFTESDAQGILAKLVESKPSKSDVGLELVELEKAAEIVLLEQDEDETSSDDDSSSEEEESSSEDEQTSENEHVSVESVTEQLKGFEIKEVSSRAL